MRFYSFTNMYTSGIHAGIQTAHAVHEMLLKYEADNDDRKAKRRNLYDWLENHKTIIVKQAGYHSSLEALYDELKESSAWLDLPVIRWRESKEALNGATTAVGIVVPASIYNMSRSLAALKREEYSEPTSPEQQLADIIHRYPMAS